MPPTVSEVEVDALCQATALQMNEPHSGDVEYELLAQPLAKTLDF